VQNIFLQHDLRDSPNVERDSLFLFEENLNKAGNGGKGDFRARSPNHFGCGKEIRIAYFQCVCSFPCPARTAHAPYCIDIRGLSGSTQLSHITSQAARFLEKMY